MATYQNKRPCKSDQVVKEQLRAGRKALKYVRRKTDEMEKEISSYLSFPDLLSPMSFIGSSLEDVNKDKASASDLSE